MEAIVDILGHKVHFHDYDCETYEDIVHTLFNEATPELKSKLIEISEEKRIEVMADLMIELRKIFDL